MKLKEALKNIDVMKTLGSLSVAVSSVCHDSREIGNGGLFVAIDGYRQKGPDYIDAAVSKGARAVICQDISSFRKRKGVTFIQVSDARSALSAVSSNFYGRPSKKLNMVGITGTNGKTTVCYLTESILKAAGRRVAVTGTINYRAPGIEREAGRTTPEAHHLHSFLDEAVKMKVTDVVMEASSHALYLKRLEDVHFNICLFTNLTSDHLDFHKTREDYARAKNILFERILERSSKDEKFAVLNWDDPYSRKLTGNKGAKVIKFGLQGGNEIGVISRSIESSGIKAKIKVFDSSLEIESSLIGAHNLSNILGAVSISHCLGIDQEHIVKGIRDLKLIPGRLQKIDNELGLNVYVDYAHTDDALKNVISNLSKISKGKIITVFGCGGDRDRGKRSKMGAISTQLSDITVITSDNPRNENPSSIIAEILNGIDTREVTKINGVARDIMPGERYYLVEEDRGEAIKKAISLASSGDSILIAGKGHEEYQEFENRKIFFSDSDFTRKVLAER